MKRIIALLLCMIMTLVLVSCGGNGNPDPTAEPTAAPEPEKNYGLHVEEDGTITLGGEPYYAFGTNWHGGFSRLLLDNPDLDYTPYFEALANGIPVIRTMMNVFYSDNTWRTMYDDDALFYAMDKYIAYCEKYHIGLIMSMNWCFGNTYDVAGEKLSESLGDPNAEGTKQMLAYAEKVVKRYKDSPAVFAWEVGNEGCLAADRGNGSSIQMGEYNRLFAEKIREYDDYRLITTGDSMVFECTKALRETGKWSPNDTREDKIETLMLYNQDPINCIEDHFYGHQNSAGSNYQRVELVPEDMQIAKELKKGYIVGEYGAGYEEWDTLSDEEMEKNWCSIVDDLVNDGVQIALQWDFGRCAELNDEWSIELGFIKNVYQNEYQYNKIKEVNEKLVAEGKNKSAEYWADAIPLVYGKTGNELDGKLKNRSTAENDLTKDVDVLSIANWEGTTKSVNGIAFTNRANIVTTLADGSEGLVLRTKTVGTEGSTASFNNKFTLGKLISTKEGKSYTVKITAKASYGEGQSSLTDGAKFVILALKNKNPMEINADGQWHTYEYTFEKIGSANPTITVGPESVKYNAYVGAEILISDIEVYEAG